MVQPFYSLYCYKRRKYILYILEFILFFYNIMLVVWDVFCALLVSNIWKTANLSVNFCCLFSILIFDLPDYIYN